MRQQQNLEAFYQLTLVQFVMRSKKFVRFVLLLAAFAYAPQIGDSSCADNPSQFDDFVQTFDESRKYRLSSFDTQGNTSTRFPSISSTVLRSPAKAFLMIQKTSSSNQTFCEFYTLWKDRNGTLNGHYGLQDLGNDFSLQIVGFELEKLTSRLILRMCFTENAVHSFEFDLDSANPLDDADFTGKVNLNEGCDRDELRFKLYTPPLRDITIVIIVGAILGAFFLVQLVIGLVKVFGSKVNPE